MLALPPCRIWVDNQEVVDGWRKGRAWCCSAARSSADLWRKFWAKIEDIGADGICIEKCKGHATQADIDVGRSTLFLQTGNDHADHFARRGVEVAVAQVPVKLLKDAYAEARQWYEWLLSLCGHWPADIDPRPKASEKASGKGGYESGRSTARNVGAVRSVQLGRSGHMPQHPLPMQPNGQFGHCTRARLTHPPQQAGANALEGQAAPPIAGPIGDSPAAKANVTIAKVVAVVDRGVHSSHGMRTAGPIFFCNVCGSCAEHRVGKALKDACIGAGHGSQGPKASQLNNLRAGRHPLTGSAVGATAKAPAAAKAKARSKARVRAKALLGDPTRILSALERLVQKRLAGAFGRLCMTR